MSRVVLHLATTTVLSRRVSLGRAVCAVYHYTRSKPTDAGLHRYLLLKSLTNEQQFPIWIDNPLGPAGYMRCTLEAPKNKICISKGKKHTIPHDIIQHIDVVPKWCDSLDAADIL